MKSEHIPPILQIEKQVNPSPWSESSLNVELSNPQATYFVAETSDSTPVGFCGFWKVIDEAHITNISVDPQHQRKGIASMLLKNVINACLQNGINCSTLEVRESNLPAIQLYKKFGFHVSAVRKKYYPDNQENAIVMWNHDLSKTNETL